MTLQKQLAAEMKAHADLLNGDSKPTTDAEIRAWQSEWDRINAAYDAAKSNPLSSLGRDGGTIAQGPTHREFFAGNRDAAIESNLASALSGWLRNQSGLPVRTGEWQASQNLGLDPRGGAFDIPLGHGLPTNGNNRQVFNSLSGLQPSTGGVLVPDSSALHSRFESAMKSFSGVVQVADIWRTTDGRSAPWPMIDDTDNSGSQVGEATDVGEAVEPTFSAKTFNAYKLTSGVLKVPYELLEDSAMNLASILGAKLGERLGRTLESKATNGNGASTLEGLMTSVPTGKTTASSTAIAADELIDLQHSVNPAYRSQGNVGWMMNDETVKFIRKLKDGEGRYLWEDSIKAGEPPMLLGYPVTFNQEMSSTLTTGEKPIVFGKLNEYKLRIVGNLRLRTLTERYAETDQTGFIAFLRCDGMLLKPSATDSLCPIQALEMA